MTFWPGAAVNAPACWVLGALSRRAVISKPYTAACESVTVITRFMVWPGVYDRPLGNVILTAPPPPFSAVPVWHCVQAMPGRSPGAGVNPFGGPNGNAQALTEPNNPSAIITAVLTKLC